MSFCPICRVPLDPISNAVFPTHLPPDVAYIRTVIAHEEAHQDLEAQRLARRQLLGSSAWVVVWFLLCVLLPIYLINAK